MTDQHPLICHVLGAARQVDAENGWQELRAEPNRQRDGEEQGLDRGSAAGNVHQKHHDGHHDHGARQQVAEPTHPSVELGRGRLHAETAGDCPELRAAARANDQATPGAAAYVGAHEDAVLSTRERRDARTALQILQHRVALTGEGRFAHVKVDRFEQHGVGRDETARRQQHDITGHQPICRDSAHRTVAQHADERLDPRFEGRCRILCVELARKPHDDTRENDDQNDGRVDQLAGER